MASDFEIVDGRAVPVSELARGLVWTLLWNIVGMEATLRDGTRRVGRVELDRDFTGPDAAGWFTGWVSVQWLEYEKCAPEFAAMVPRDSTGYPARPETRATVEIAIDARGSLVFRADGRTGDRLPDFDVRAFLAGTGAE